MKHRLNQRVVSLIEGTNGAELAGSLYAARPRERAALAAELSARGHWVHADLFGDPAAGVSPGLVADLADAGSARVDVHLIDRGALAHLADVCRPGIARVTVPFDDELDVAAVSRQIQACGAQAWVALDPQTAVRRVDAALPHADGVLIMLVRPGTRSSAARLDLLAKVGEAAALLPAGVDGGVSERNVEQILSSGARYIVVGRGLLADDKTVPIKEMDKNE